MKGTDAEGLTSIPVGTGGGGGCNWGERELAFKKSETEDMTNHRSLCSWNRGR